MLLIVGVVINYFVYGEVFFEIVLFELILVFWFGFFVFIWLFVVVFVVVVVNFCLEWLCIFLMMIFG